MEHSLINSDPLFYVENIGKERESARARETHLCILIIKKYETLRDPQRSGSWLIRFNVLEN